MIPHNAYDIQVVMNMFQGLVMKEFMCRVSHSISVIRRLIPNVWVGSPVTER